MSNIRSCTILGWIIFLVSACTSESNTVSTHEYGAFEIHRGTNIAHWLSQSERRGHERAAFFTKKDIGFIDSVGFDHIRLPIDEVQMWDENEGRYADAFRLLEECL